MAVFLLFFQILFQSVQIQGGRVQTEAGIEEGLYSVFAQYNRELFQRFHVFFLDGGYGTGKFHFEQPYKMVQECLQESFSSCKNMDICGKNLWNCKVNTGGITGYTLATDDAGEQFKKQAVDYMRNTAGIQGIQTFMEKAKREKEEIENSSWKESLQKAAEAQKQVEHVKQEQQLEEEKTDEREQVVNPLEVIKEIKKKGILSLTMPQGIDLSEKILEVDSLCSKRRLHTGMGIENNRKSDLFMDQVLFQQYMNRHFSCFGEEKEGPSIKYQMEYIIGGKDNDMDNLKTVIHQLLFMRMGPNMLYLLQDRESQKCVHELALLMSAVIQNPSLESIFATAFTAAWAYGESILDMRNLTEGKKVPVWKDKNTWNLLLKETGEFSLKKQGIKNNQGKDYREYVEMLLWKIPISKQVGRAMDIVEQVMRTEGEQKNFAMDLCVSWLQVEMQVRCGGKDFSIVREYGYEM